MHPYSIDAAERKIVPLFLAGIAIVCAWLLNVCLATFHGTIPWWVDAPSVVGFYSLFYGLFNQYLWRTRILYRIGLLNTPVLIGSWKGTLTSSFGPSESKSVDVKINQTWTEIEILLKTNSSKSHSLAASILVQAPGGSILNYQYQSDPLPSAPDGMGIHYGTTKLTLAGGKLEGDYYSGRGRQNIGSISVVKIS